MKIFVRFSITIKFENNGLACLRDISINEGNAVFIKIGGVLKASLYWKMLLFLHPLCINEVPL